MQREVLWTPVDTPGIEHLRLIVSPDEIVADGHIITTQFDERPIRIDYRINCDTERRVRELHVSAEDVELRSVNLWTEGSGKWTNESGDSLPELEGCIDVDIMATPFTNTLPIRRIAWQPGQTEELKVVYVKLPSLEVVATGQRYTCLESGPDGGLFRYESLESGYTNELPVDADGLVMDYPGIWQRVWPK